MINVFKIIRKLILEKKLFGERDITRFFKKLLKFCQ